MAKGLGFTEVQNSLERDHHTLFHKQANFIPTSFNRVISSSPPGRAALLKPTSFAPVPQESQKSPDIGMVTSYIYICQRTY